MREQKFPLYARHGIAEAWLVDLEEDRVGVHPSPRANGCSQITLREPGDRVSPRALPVTCAAIAGCSQITLHELGDRISPRAPPVTCAAIAGCSQITLHEPGDRVSPLTFPDLSLTVDEIL